MSSQMTRLISRVERLDPELAAALEAQHRAALANVPFGLHFERHLPESVELPGLAVRVGSKVHILPERGHLPKNNEVAAENARRSRLWVVRSASGRGEDRVARIESRRPVRSPEDADSFDEMLVPVDKLVAVAEFEDEIYPGLSSTGRVERGGDKPFHTVINAENYHALEALAYCCEGQVDCVYVDPPYNTGAKDWKYSNDYVDKEDVYRHSKWLSFMEKRLVLAQRLLNPADSVLIVTIDEKEYLRLGLLLEQVFPEARIQMVSSAVNPANQAREGAFARNDEYIFFVLLGAGGPSRLSLDREWVSAKGRTFTGKIRWDLLRRSGTGASRSDSPGGFYPIYVSAAGGTISQVGEPLAAGASEPAPVDGCVAVLPIRKDSSEGRWQVKPSVLRGYLKQGRVKVGGSRDTGFVIYYLKPGEYKKVQSGEYQVRGTNPDGSMDVAEHNGGAVVVVPTTQWRIRSHDATQYGSRLLAKFLPGRRFPFPKSLYAVEDALRFFVHGKPSALVVDFFAGSGTTAHALMRLNKQDGGRRRSISITNNEVSVAEQKTLIARGLLPGDPDWEKWGICEHITKPRIETAITGVTPGGNPVDGDYKFTDEFPMSQGLEENVEFLTLTYENRRTVAHRMAFTSVAPLLWMKAGSEGPRIDTLDGFAVTQVYGVLEDLNLQRDFTNEVRYKGARMAFVVTDDDRAFQTVCADLPEKVTKVRLYESYLTNFAINTTV